MKPRKSRPKAPLPHKRGFGEGAAYFEQRGTRKINAPDWPKPPKDDFMRRAREMVDGADWLLKREGELTYFGARRCARGGGDGPVTLLAWAANIGTRFGFSSQIFLGAKYLAVLHETEITLEDQKVPFPKKMAQVYALCDAWHWFHREAYEEHRKEFMGARTIDNLAKPHANRSEEKQQRKPIIAKCCEVEWAENPLLSEKAGPTARKIFEDVNKKLNMSGHSQYGNDKSLESVILEIIRDAKAARP